jgi:hypothetical protein
MNSKSILFGLLAICTLAAFECKKEKTLSGCYKGRLEIKGICMNYTIKILEGNVDSSQVETTWTNPATGQSHQNVFGLASVCDFPADINQGDEFYFQIVSAAPTDCAVCMAYYPTPQKHLAIKVTKDPCN